MTYSEKKCTKNISEPIEHQGSVIDIKQNSFQYLLLVEGDSNFKLTGTSARKDGAKAEYTSAGWVFRDENEAKAVAKRWTSGKRKLTVIRWKDPLVDEFWYGSKAEANLAIKQIRHEITSHKLNEKKAAIILQCHAAGLHPSWLYDASLPEDMIDSERKAYAIFKPLWDNAQEEQKDVDLQGSDIELQKQDLVATPPQSSSFDFTVRSLMRNERGDAELFLSIFKDRYLFDSTEGRSGEFYRWTGSCWEVDKKKQRYRDIEEASDLYEKASIEAKKDNAELVEPLSKRAFSLRSSKRCKSVFEFVSTEIHLNGEWDCCPEKLPCSNGIVDLKTGEISVHKPELLLRSICPTSYTRDAQRPLFDQFLNDITLDDMELKSFIGRVLGSALLGTCKEEKLFIFYGKDGRNGKGTLMQTLEKILGPLAKTFPSEMLLLQRNPPSSSTPRPEKANLQGVRLAIFSEIDEKRHIDASEIKNLSGGDTITCRRLFSNTDIQIRPSHTMIIQTNFKPKASAKDGALWKRTVLIPFKAEFVANPQKDHERKLDEGFKERLLLEREGILAWLIEGCREYLTKGLNIPEQVKKETEDYRKENDGIERFLSEMCIEDPVFTTQKTKMTNAIKKFCTENRCEEPNRPEILHRLREKYVEFDTNSGSFWKGVKIIDEQEIKT